MIDMGAIYSADTLKTSADNNNTQYFYNLDVLFNLDNRKTFCMGWSVFGISQSITAGTTQSTYSSFDMGPAIRWNMDHAGVFSATLAYGYLAKGSYSTGSTTSETWEGSSYFAQLAAQVPVRDDKFYIGLSLNYYGGNYSKKTVNNVESSNDAQKTWIFPMISMTWRQ